MGKAPFRAGFKQEGVHGRTQPKERREILSIVDP
jgi:hypothetical protein